MHRYHKHGLGSGWLAFLVAYSGLSHLLWVRSCFCYHLSWNTFFYSDRWWKTCDLDLWASKLFMSVQVKCYILWSLTKTACWSSLDLHLSESQLFWLPIYEEQFSMLCNVSYWELFWSHSHSNLMVIALLILWIEKLLGFWWDENEITGTFHDDLMITGTSHDDHMIWN